MAASSPPPSATEHANNDNNDLYFSTIESIMRVTLAGFGGALAGVSFARRGASAGGSGAAVVRQAASALAKTAANNNAAKKQNGAVVGLGNKVIGDGSKLRRLKRQRPIIRTTPPSAKPYVDRELPTAWAIACMSFAGVIECARLWSPTTMIWEVTQGNTFDIGKSLALISDHIIGGAIAGALFKGSAVRTRTGARIDASIMGSASPVASNLSAVKGKPLMGILPGAALGLLAGIAIVAADRAEVAVKEKFGHLDGEDIIGNDDAVIAAEGGREDPIPADIKAMSTEEIAKEIEALKKGIRKDDGNIDNEKVVDASGSSETEQKEVRDLISALGFRPHRTQ